MIFKINHIKNLVLITSKITVSNKNLSYAQTRSIYTKQQRYEQTLKTIESIKKYINNSFIILIDNSDFDNDNEILTGLRENVHILLNPRHFEELDFFTNDYLFKFAAEMNQTNYFINFFDNFNISFDNLFKISGRYQLNDKFNYNNYDNEYNIFKKNPQVVDREYYFTSLYKIAYCEYENYKTAVNNIKTKYKYYSNLQFNDLETILPNQLKFKEIDELGLTEYISVENIIRDV